MRDRDKGRELLKGIPGPRGKAPKPAIEARRIRPWVRRVEEFTNPRGDILHFIVWKNAGFPEIVVSREMRPAKDTLATDRGKRMEAAHGGWCVTHRRTMLRAAPGGYADVDLADKKLGYPLEKAKFLAELLAGMMAWGEIDTEEEARRRVGEIRDAIIAMKEADIIRERMLAAMGKEEGFGFEFKL